MTRDLVHLKKSIADQWWIQAIMRFPFERMSDFSVLGKQAKLPFMYFMDYFTVMFISFKQHIDHSLHLVQQLLKDKNPRQESC